MVKQTTQEQVEQAIKAVDQANAEQAIPHADADAKIAWPEIPEAGGVCWVDMYGTKTDAEGMEHIVKISVTSRHINPIKALVGLVDAIKFAESEYSLRPYTPSYGTSVKPPQAATTAPAVAVPQTTVVPPPPGEVKNKEPEYVAVEDDGGVIQAIRMSVEPRADGKTKLGFYGAGDKYPRLTSVMLPPALVQLLASTGAWTVEHFSKVAEYKVDYKVTWHNSQNVSKQTGKPYKNIVSVSL